jgi:periplasmic divalent cation tolerance protein
MSESYCVILTTAGNQVEANRLAEMLLLHKLAACVQSHYTWKGQVHHEAEYLLLIKTASRLYDEVESAITENHSYEIPEIVQIPISQGLDSYLGWVSENIRSVSDEE